MPASPRVYRGDVEEGQILYRAVVPQSMLRRELWFEEHTVTRLTPQGFWFAKTRPAGLGLAKAKWRKYGTHYVSLSPEGACYSMRIRAYGWLNHLRRKMTEANIRLRLAEEAASRVSMGVDVTNGSVTVSTMNGLQMGVFTQAHGVAAPPSFNMARDIERIEYDRTLVELFDNAAAFRSIVSPPEVPQAPEAPNMPDIPDIPQFEDT